MHPLAASAFLLGFYALGAAAAILAARWLRRPLPAGARIFFFLLPLLLLYAGFFQGKAPIGPDQAFLTVPEARSGPRASFWTNDVARQFAPWAQALRLSWEARELPHRDRWNGCGTPLGANGQSAAYSPITLLGLLLPGLAPFTFWAGLRLFLCLTGTWLWLTELGISGPAAAFGATAFGLSMSMTAWIFFPHTAALCVWPWVLFLLERTAAEEAAIRRRSFLALTGALALWPLSGHLESVVSASAFTGLWLAMRALLGERKRALRIFRPAAAAAALALGLTAFSLLPQALAIRDSNRMALAAKPFWSPILSWRPHRPAWARGAWVVLLPRLFGDRITSPPMAGAAGGFPEMALGYFGIMPAACLVLFLRPGTRRPLAERALLAPLIFGIGAPIGLWPFAEIASRLPALAHMFPLRYLTWFSLAGATMAAFELDRLQRDLDRRRLERFWPLAALAAVGLVVFFLFRQLRGAYDAAGALPAQRHAFLAAGAALAAGFAAFAATSGKAERFLRWGLPLLTLLAAAELSYQGARLYAWDPPDRLYVQTPLVRFLRGRPLPFRVVGEGSMFFPNVSVFAGVEDVRTHDPAERRDYVEFLDATCGYDPTPYFKTIVNVNAPGLDFLNTRYLIAAPGRTAPSEKWTRVYDGPDGTVFENARVMPRVFAPARVRVVRKQASGMLPTPAGEAYGTPFHELFGDVDWHREALVLDDGRGGFRAAELAAEGRVEVSDYAETTNTVRFRSRVGGAPGGATLVTSLVEDGGWRGRDENGAPIALARANGPFLALHVASGDHSVRLDYASPGFRLGRAVSLASLLLGALAAAASKRRPAGAS